MGTDDKTDTQNVNAKIIDDNITEMEKDEMVEKEGENNIFNSSVSTHSTNLSVINIAMDDANTYEDVFKYNNTNSESIQSSNSILKNEELGASAFSNNLDTMEKSFASSLLTEYNDKQSQNESEIDKSTSHIDSKSEVTNQSRINTVDSNISTDNDFVETENSTNESNTLSELESMDNQENTESSISDSEFKKNIGSKDITRDSLVINDYNSSKSSSAVLNSLSEEKSTQVTENSMTTIENSRNASDDSSLDGSNASFLSSEMNSNTETLSTLLINEVESRSNTATESTPLSYKTSGVDSYNSFSEDRDSEETMSIQEILTSDSEKSLNIMSDIDNESEDSSSNESSAKNSSSSSDVRKGFFASNEDSNISYESIDMDDAISVDSNINLGNKDLRQSTKKFASEFTATMIAKSTGKTTQKNTQNTFNRLGITKNPSVPDSFDFKNLIKKMEALNEIFESELTYFNDIFIWGNDVKNLILTDNKLSIKKRTDLANNLFNMIDEIVDLHSKVIEGMVKVNQSIWPRKLKDRFVPFDLHQISDMRFTERIENLPSIFDLDRFSYTRVFLMNLNLYTCYIDYSRRLPKSEYELETIYSENIHFKNLLDNFFKELNMQHFGIKHFLYRPPQKIARYDMLLKAVYKAEIDSVHQEDIMLLRQKFSDLNTKMDISLGEITKSFESFKLQKSIKYATHVQRQLPLGLHYKHQSIIKQSHYNIIIDKNDTVDGKIQPKERHIVLLTNLILICDINIEKGIKTIITNPYHLINTTAIDTHIDIDYLKDIHHHSKRKVYLLYLVEKNRQDIVTICFYDSISRSVLKKIIDECCEEAKKTLIPNINVKNITLEEDIGNHMGISIGIRFFFDKFNYNIDYEDDALANDWGYEDENAADNTLLDDGSDSVDYNIIRVKRCCAINFGKKCIHDGSKVDREEYDLKVKSKKNIVETTNLSESRKTLDESEGTIDTQEESINSTKDVNKEIQLYNMLKFPKYSDLNLKNPVINGNDYLICQDIISKISNLSHGENSLSSSKYIFTTIKQKSSVISIKNGLSKKLLHVNHVKKVESLIESPQKHFGLSKAELRNNFLTPAVLKPQSKFISAEKINIPVSLKASDSKIKLRNSLNEITEDSEDIPEKSYNNVFLGTVISLGNNTMENILSTNNSSMSININSPSNETINNDRISSISGRSNNVNKSMNFSENTNTSSNISSRCTKGTNTNSYLETKSTESKRIESKSSDSNTIESKSCESNRSSMASDSKSTGSNKIKSKSGGSSIIESKSSESNKIESKSSESNKKESKSSESTKLSMITNSKSSESDKITSKSNESDKITSKSSESNKIESKFSDMNTIDLKSSKTNKKESKSSESENSEFSSKLKSGESDKIESKSSESNKIESKSSESNKIESKSSESNKIESKSSESNKIESKYTESNKIESKSTESATLELISMLKSGESDKISTSSSNSEDNSAASVLKSGKSNLTSLTSEIKTSDSYSMNSASDPKFSESKNESMTLNSKSTKSTSFITLNSNPSKISKINSDSNSSTSNNIDIKSYTSKNESLDLSTSRSTSKNSSSKFNESSSKSLNSKSSQSINTNSNSQHSENESTDSNVNSEYNIDTNVSSNSTASKNSENDQKIFTNSSDIDDETFSSSYNSILSETSSRNSLNTFNEWSISRENCNHDSLTLCTLPKTYRNILTSSYIFFHLENSLELIEPQIVKSDDNTENSYNYQKKQHTIYKNSVEKMILDDLRGVIIILSEEKLLIGFFDVDTPISYKLVTKNVKNFYYYKLTSTLAVVKTSNNNINYIEIFHVEFYKNDAKITARNFNSTNKVDKTKPYLLKDNHKDKIVFLRKKFDYQDINIKFMMSNRLHMGSNIKNIHFVRRYIVIVCDEFEIIDTNSLQSSEIIDSLDFIIPYFTDHVKKLVPIKILEISGNEFFLVYNNTGFTIDNYGRNADNHRVFTWAYTINDAKIIKSSHVKKLFGLNSEKGWICLLSETAIEIWDIYTGNAIFIKSIRSLKFIKNTELPITYDKNEVYFFFNKNK